MTVRLPFATRLRDAWVNNDSLLCVGLDPDINRIPLPIRERDHSLLEFCRAVVDATAAFVCAFKPQAAYFAARGEEDALARLIAYIHERYPDIPVILDAKRGDIGATARLYAEEAFVRFDADAVTVSPYLGRESIEPYLRFEDRGVILLCRTSNADSGWLQCYPEDDPVYLRVARAAAQWNERGNLMLVAGATYAQELVRIREVVGDMPLLVPGIGAQGGDLAEVLRAGRDSHGRGLIINASRAVLYAGEGQSNYADGFAAAAGAAAQTFRDEIRQLQIEMAPDGAVI